MSVDETGAGLGEGDGVEWVDARERWGGVGGEGGVETVAGGVTVVTGGTLGRAKERSGPGGRTGGTSVDGRGRGSGRVCAGEIGGGGRLNRGAPE